MRCGGDWSATRAESRSRPSGLDRVEKTRRCIGIPPLGTIHCHFVKPPYSGATAGRAILARQPVRLPHPVEVDAAMPRREHPLGMLPRLFGYPLSSRVRVCGTHRFLQRCLPVVLSLWPPPSLGRVPAIPVPRRQQYYAVATTSCPASLRLIDSPAGTTLRLLVRSLSPAGRGGPGPLVSARGPSGLPSWTVQDLPGSPASPPVAMRTFSDPGRPVAPRPGRRFRYGPRYYKNEGVDIEDFEAQ